MHSPWPRECNFHDVIYVIGTQNKHRVAHGKHLPWRIYTSLARKRLEIDLFCQLFGYPKANFGPLQGGSFTHFIIIMRLFIFDPKVHRESSNKVSLKSPSENISAIRIGNIPIQSQRAIPMCYLPWSKYQIYSENIGIRCKSLM